jgi:peptidoglycan/LPS O-acetylase OafA/YrhL
LAARRGTVRTIGQAFNPRNNSLNFLRLALASVVVLSHAFPLGGFNVPNAINGTGYGELAVYGFFGISGYLIAGSAIRHRPGRYLWQRFLRIFPGFWACLIVTALLFGVIAWLKGPPVPHCNISCYFDARVNSPWGYVYRNMLLTLHQSSIAGTPRGTSLPLVWNGSLWSLYYEFLCYLILMAFALLGLLRHRLVMVTATAGLWVAVAMITFIPGLDAKFNVFHNDMAFDLLKLAATFMVGSVIFLYRDRIPDSGWLALASAGLLVGCLFWPNGGLNPSFDFTTSDLLTPLIAYPLIWLGIHLPLQRVGSRNDYSYGMYIYGFPVAQLLVIWGVQKWGLVPYAVMSILCTVPLAVASWWAIEKHALKMKTLGLPQRVVTGRDANVMLVRTKDPP